MRKDESGNLVFTHFQRFIRLCVSVGPILYFTINKLANLNFIPATKVNRRRILLCLLSDNFFDVCLFKSVLWRDGKIKRVGKNNICIFMANICLFQWKHLSTLFNTDVKKCNLTYSEGIYVHIYKYISLWSFSSLAWKEDLLAFIQMLIIKLGLTRKARLSYKCSANAFCCVSSNII